MQSRHERSIIDIGLDLYLRNSFLLKTELDQ